MIRNYNKNGGSNVDLSPIYSQLNTINNWIQNADFDTRLSQSVVSLSNNFTNFTNTIDNYIDNYMYENLSQTLSAITNSVTKNEYDISILSQNTTVLKTSIDNVYTGVFYALQQFTSQIDEIKTNTSSINDSITQITQNTDLLKTAVSVLSTRVTQGFNVLMTSMNDITNNTSSMNDSITQITNDTNSLQSAIESVSTKVTQGFNVLMTSLNNITNNTTSMQDDISNLNSSVSYILNNIDTNPQTRLIVSQYTKSLFTKNLPCLYNPYSATLWVNDLSYNSLVQPDQYISFYGGAISSVNDISLNMRLFNVTADVGTCTMNSATINTVSMIGGKQNNSYGLDVELNSGAIYNGTFRSFDHLLIQNYSYHNLDLRDINRCNLFDNTRLFYTINVDNVWMFQMSNSNTENYTQNTLDINNCSIVSLSSLGNISSVNINNCFTYILNNCNISTCKINCTNTVTGISTQTQIGVFGNNISLLSANNIANNVEFNTFSTAVLEYNQFKHEPHKIANNSISALYFQYFDYSYFEMYMNKIHNNTILSLYLPVECNFYQTMNSGTYDYSIINSIAEYFRSNNTISYIFPWFK